MKLALKQMLPYCGATNLPSKEESERIAYNIMNLAKTIKTGATKVAFSDIVPEIDTFNQNASKNLKNICKEKRHPIHFTSKH